MCQKDPIEMISELDIIQMVCRRFGGVSTKISRELCEYAGITPQMPYELSGYKISTQTIILEMKNVRFNDFLMDMDIVQRNLYILMDKNSPAVPDNLLSIKAKKFEIYFHHDKKQIECQRHYQSQLNEMNSSMEFQYVARKQDGKVRRGKGKKLGKVYILRLFRNGMLQIPGVDDHFDMSEASQVVKQMTLLYESLFEAEEKVTIANKVIAMANYVASMNIPADHRINLSVVCRDVKKDPSNLLKLCDEHGLKCVSFELASTRVVLFAKFIVPKEKSPYISYNPSSTSNRKHLKTITLQVTQRGIVTVQGADGNFEKTAKLIRAFQHMAPKLFNPQLFKLSEPAAKA